MDIKQLYTIGGADNILTEVETALKLSASDYNESDYETIKRNVIGRINREYQVDLSKGKINDPSFEAGIYRTAVALLLDNMAMMHAKLCAYCQTCRYLTSSDVSLQAINYMSFTEDSLKNALKLAQREKTLPKIDEAMSAIKEKIVTIRMSKEKRFFMLMLLSYDLGLYEMTATIAEILYFGGVV